ncbi:hypothetical protein AGMMS50267_07680 [Spirochaetia bacterium]|nr:hypothetical protein AGMMS50267_07610 [Spirochaetia bacterium]GHV88408.1 hypothetical protein AGMMS50267_07680 [Spirochaetia bacterium]
MNRYTVILKKLLLCFCAAGANYLLAGLLGHFKVPLFMDTLFTLTVTFIAGPLYGCLTAALTVLAFQLLNDEYLLSALYFFCSGSGVILAAFFSRSHHLAENEKPGSFNILTMLLILSLEMCLVISITGGLIARFILLLDPVSGTFLVPHNYYFLGLLLNHVPLPVAEIVSRIPVNIPDRLLSVYGGYGIAVLLKNSRIFGVTNPEVPGGC